MLLAVQNRKLNDAMIKKRQTKSRVIIAIVFYFAVLMELKPSS